MRKKYKNEGSITLEAAMVVPMFIILMLLVNGFFVLFMGQQIMTHTLIQSTKSLAFDPYSTERVAANTEDDLADMFVDIFSFENGNHTATDKWYEDPDKIEEVVEERYLAYLKQSKEDAKELLSEIGVKNGFNGLDFSGSTVEDGVLTVKLQYTQEFIFNAMDLTSFDRELCAKVKLFTYEE